MVHYLLLLYQVRASEARGGFNPVSVQIFSAFLQSQEKPRINFFSPDLFFVPLSINKVRTFP